MFNTHNQKLNSTFTPLFSNDDERFKLAKYSYNLFSLYFKDIRPDAGFDEVSKKLDYFYDHLDKEIKN